MLHCRRHGDACSSGRSHGLNLNSTSNILSVACCVQKSSWFSLHVQVTSGVGFVFVEFADPAASVKAQKALHGRMFGENEIDASYYSEELMAQKQYI